ncbi:MAG: LysR family transcriptional regulator [Proteobacteria bacterium]|nr:LysR family transcriptional regulator [Pseudomonadota bacterium]
MKYKPTLRQLFYLVAVARHQNFSRAAEACFVTQSTLSAGIMELERLLGAPLVERTKRMVRITALGLEVVRQLVGNIRIGDLLLSIVFKVQDGLDDGVPIHGSHDARQGFRAGDGRRPHPVRLRDPSTAKNDGNIST